MGGKFVMPIISKDGVTIEISQHDLELSNTGEMSDVPARSIRNSLLSETDVWALSDRTMTAEQTAYRQALRDITNQPGFPNNIEWPTKPEGN